VNGLKNKSYKTIKKLNKKTKNNNMRISLWTIYIHVNINYSVTKHCTLISYMSSDTFRTTEKNKNLKKQCAKKDKN